MKPDEVIISIKPYYAEEILAGRKTIELRRRIPNISKGSRLWIYATMPVGSIIGFATVKNIMKGSPAYIWQESFEQTLVGRDHFDAYFQGAGEAVGLVLMDIKRCVPASIEKIKLIRENFHPPQVMLKLSDLEAVSLRDICGEVRHEVLRRTD